MKQIMPPNELAAKSLGAQKLSNASCRLCRHVLRVPCGEGELWYHDLTGEIVLLEQDEHAEAHQDELFRRWFLVPETFDDYKTAKELRTLAELLAPKKKGISKFVVFTTTDCNARCFYCYELGRKRQPMSERVANDAADYILRHSGGQRVELQWFGGEPLYNRAAIETITRRLRDADADFHSIMVSNGYLFDEETVKTAVADWKLDFVQITLDGREETYNRVKAYIHHDGSAYRRVLRNIGLLLDAGVRVSVRMNMKLENADELWQLSDDLKEQFGGRAGFSASCVLLRDFTNDAQRYGDGAEGLQRYEALQRKLISDGIGVRKYTRRDISVNQCMADNDASVTILPDGRLGKCEHESEDKLIGSIYGDAPDSRAIAAWKERIAIPECRDCLFAPSCIRLKQCAWHKQGCTELDRMMPSCETSTGLRVR